jgi:hypothetical protein
MHPFHGGESGSIPLGSAKIPKWLGLISLFARLANRDLAGISSWHIEIPGYRVPDPYLH